MCCGHKRAALAAPGMASRSGSAPARSLAPAWPAPMPAPADAHFEYTGATAMVAQGPVTRRVYRFAHPQARVAVDARDAQALARITTLRRVG
jgi:hypothetical protein